MARIVVGVVGAVAGYFISGGNPYGALQGFALAYGLSAGLDPNSKILGPKLADLKAPQAAYGAPIPYIEGSPRLAGCYIWSSDKRAVATTTSTGGKGGPGVDSTVYSYEIDCLIELAINRCEAIRRVWSNGRLVWSNADDATGETLTASASTNSWRDIRFYSGAPDQLPDPTYEAAVGIGNAPAYRGRTTVMVEGMNLGQSGQLPVLTFEVLSESEPSALAATFASVEQDNGVLGQGASPFSPDGFLLHLGQWSNTYSNTHVLVYQVDRNGTYTEVTEYDADANSPSAHGQTDVAGIMSAVGDIGSGPGDPYIMYWSEVRDDELTHYRYAYSLPGTEPFSAGGVIGGESARFCMKGDVLILGSSQFGSGKIHRYSKAAGALLAGPLPIVSSAATTYKEAFCTDGTLLYALEYVGNTIEVFDVLTLTLQDTITVPSPVFGQDCSIVMNDDGDLFFFHGSAGNAYRWDGSTWLDEYPGVIPDKSTPQVQFGVADDVLFEMYPGGIPTPGPQTIRAFYRTVAVADVTLDQVVRRLCLRTGLLTDDDIDVTELASDIVKALAVSQVSTTRATLEILMAAYFFECVEGEKLRFVKRGGSSVMTIPYADLAAGPDGTSEPLPLKRLNDIEIAARVSVKFANMLNDFQDGLVQADRLVTDSTAEQVVELPIGFTPAEAAKVADVNTMDNAVKLVQIGPVSLPRSYSALEPTDIVTLTNLDGSTFRSRIVKGTIGGGVNTFELVLDDATVINSDAVTDEDYASSTLVRLLGDTTLVPMDIAPLSDALSGIGYLVAFGSEGSWPGADLDKSLDDVTYSKVISVGDRAVMGTASTVLGDFTGGNVFDEVNTLTVDVGDGVLSSTTRDLMLTAKTNPLAVGSNEDGWEVLQFRTATFVSPGVYTLSGFLRGRRGTEWTMAGHQAGEQVVLLQATGIRHIDDTMADIGVSYFLKAVTFGQSIAVVDAQSFTDTGVSQMPFAPVDLRIDGTQKITWHRRSRLASRFLATVDPPLGELTEVYDVEVRDGADVLLESATVTTPEYTVVGSLAGNTATVWQKSATVGRGYPATLEL